MGEEDDGHQDEQVEDLIDHDGQPEGGLDARLRVPVHHPSPPNDRPTSVEEEVGDEDRQKPEHAHLHPGKGREEAERVLGAVG